MRLPSSRFASSVTPWVPERKVLRRGCSVMLAGVLLAIAAQVTPAQEPQWDAATRKAHAEAFVRQRARAASESTASPQTIPMAAQPRDASLTEAWQPLGPVAVTSARFGKVTGRVTAIAVDSSDPAGNTVYVGTTGGGVWKSTNAAGGTDTVLFAPLTDTLPVFAANTSAGILPSLSIGAVSVQPIANGIVLAGTGDPNDATDSYYGEGILRSTDGGQTWALAQRSNDGTNGTHSFIGLGSAGFAWSTATPSLVVAAMSSSAEGELVGAVSTNSVRGLYYSTDAGVNWKMATLYDGASIVQQPLPLGAGGGAGSAATAVVWNPLRRRFYAAVRAHGFYESVDGATWTRMTSQPGTGLTTAACPVGVNGVGAATCPIFRGALAVQPVSGDLFALSVDAAENDNGLWQDACAVSGSSCAGAVAFARVDAGQMEAGSGSKAIVQGSYNLTLAAAPAPGGTLLLAGTVDVYRCVIAAGSSGCALRNTTNALNGCNAPAMVTPAQHALAITGSAPLVFLGNDGGLWRSVDGVAETGPPCGASDAQHFDNLNGALGSLAEVVGFAQAPVDADTFIAGLGANGSAASTSASSAWNARLPWPQMNAGEGGFPSIDQSQPRNWYVATGTGVSLKACASGSACSIADFAGTATIGAAQVQNEPALLDAPIMLDPAQTTNAVAGTCRIWRGPAADGSAWSAANAISRPLDGTTTCTTSSALIRSLAAGGAATLSATTQHSGSSVLYAGMAGALDGGGKVAGHVFVTQTGATADSTTAWTDVGASPVTNDLANAGKFNPGAFDISVVTVDPHDTSGATVYATVMGSGGVPKVYRSTDFGSHWSNVSANLPSAPANALLVDPNDANTVYVAMDAGVYVTQQIADCPSASCWSLMGTALPNAPAVALAAAQNMLTGDGRRGVLRVGTYGRGIWSNPLLTANSLPQPALTLSQGGFLFGSQAINTQSPAQTLTITSTGNAAAVIGTLAVAGDFIESDTCSGHTLAVGASCVVQIRFVPTAVGGRSGTLTIQAAVPGAPLVVTLTGTGTAASTVELAPSLLTFPQTSIGQTSAAQTVSVANTGGVATPLSTPVVTGDFQVTASTCGASLGSGASCSLSVVFKPSASGARNGALSITDDAGTQTATLTGLGVAAANVTLSPTALTFAATTVGQSTGAQTITVSNTGGLATPLSLPVMTGDFRVSANTCAATLAAGAACSLSVVFTPTASGTRAGTLSVTDDAGTQTAALSGTANMATAVVLTPQSLTFAATVVGQTAAAQIITIANTGTTMTTLTAIAASGDFHIAANTCGATLATTTSCSVSVSFTPTAAGARGGALTVTGDLGTQVATLAGTGTSGATDTLAPLALSFAGQQIGTTSVSQQVTLANTGDTALSLVSALISSGPFIAVSACGTVVPAHTTCAINISFVPTATGAASGVLTVTDQFRFQTVALNGSGLAPAGVSLTPAAGLTFDAIGVGLTSLAQTMTLTNNGGVPLTISGIAASGDFHIATNSCGAVLAAASGCAIQIVFAPTAGGARSGQLTVLDSTAIGTHVAALTGNGVDFSLTPTGATSVTVASGSSAVYTLALTAPAGVSGSAAMSCTGAPSHSLCTVTPSPATLGGTTAIQVTIETGRTQASIFPPAFGPREMIWLAMLLPVGVVMRHKRLRAALMWVIAVAMLTITGCGAGRSIPPGGVQFPTTPTPAGTYAISVSAAFAGLTKTVTLTLIVK